MRNNIKTRSNNKNWKEKLQEVELEQREYAETADRKLREKDFYIVTDKDETINVHAAFFTIINDERGYFLEFRDGYKRWKTSFNMDHVVFWSEAEDVEGVSEELDPVAGRHIGVAGEAREAREYGTEDE